MVSTPATSTFAPPPEPFLPASDMEYEFCPPPRKMMRVEEDIMGPEEFGQFIIPVTSGPGPSSHTFPTTTDVETCVPVIQFLKSRQYEEEDRAYALSTLYIDQVVNLNMRRRLTYTDQLLGTMFDGPCICVSF